LLIKLLTNDRNLGFVASANRGMRLIENQDTALLNNERYFAAGLAYSLARRGILPT
jgi:GT2 family glycosyltransferase